MVADVDEVGGARGVADLRRLEHEAQHGPDGATGAEATESRESRPQQMRLETHRRQRFGEARLIRVSEREAVLEGPEGIERLQLTPGIEKTNNRPVNVTNGAQRAPARRPARNEG